MRGAEFWGGSPPGERGGATRELPPWQRFGQGAAVVACMSKRESRNKRLWSIDAVQVVAVLSKRESRSICWLSIDDMQVVAGGLNRESKGIEKGIYGHMFVQH